MAYQIKLADYAVEQMQEIVSYLQSTSVSGHFPSMDEKLG